MKIYYCWITALVASYQDAIVGGLAKKGYMVGPASKDGTLIAPGSNASSVIAINLYSQSETDAHKIHDDVTTVLKEMKAFYYSVVVAEASDCGWLGANFDISAPEKEPEPSKKTTMN